MPSLAKKKTHQNGKALVCFFAKKGGKKRGRKEILRQKDHGHGHRNLSVYRLQIIFEYGITKFIGGLVADLGENIPIFRPLV